MTTRTSGGRSDLVPASVGAALAAAVLYVVLVLPNHPAALSPRMFLSFPLEWPAILVLLAVLSPTGWITGALRALVVFALTLLTLTKLADFATFVAYDRGFNPLVDGHLIVAAWHFGSGTVGTVVAALAVLGLVVTFGLLALLLWWATGRWTRLCLPRAVRPWGAVAVLPLAAVAVAEIGDAMGRWNLPVDVPGAAFTARVAVERVEMLRATAEGLRTFRVAARTDRYADLSPILDGIGNRDVLLTYIESYGSSSLTNPRYAPTHLATLQRIEADLSARGLSMRSGWMVAPMVGGQSWLAHATVAKGLWVPDQRTYGAALVSGRRSLFHLAQRAGFRTAAVMPAITMDWPEAEFMGFDTVLPAAELGYEGLPFNWVTMPDQFTLTALDRLVLPGTPGGDRPPIFAQVALISSHAPWTPVPALVDWQAVGNGEVFDEMALSGDPPEVVWRDHDRVRDQFRQSIDYSLRAVGSYAAHHADAPRLMIVLGDHQPARFVSEDDSFAVPVHIIGPADLVDRFADWNWSEGLIPEDSDATYRMDEFRNRFLDTFSSAEVSAAVTP